MYSKTAIITLCAFLRGRNSNVDVEYLCSVTDKRKQNDGIVPIVLRFISYATLLRRRATFLPKYAENYSSDLWIILCCTPYKLKCIFFYSADRLTGLIKSYYNIKMAGGFIFVTLVHTQTICILIYRSNNSFVDCICKLVVLKSYKLNDQCSTVEWWLI